MTRRNSRLSCRPCSAVLCALVLVFFSAVATRSFGQASGAQRLYERTFRQSKSAIEKALKELQPSMSGRLPVLDGFALPADHPLSRYQRAYFQSSVDVVAVPSGGSVVRVTTKVTAWYADQTPSRSGYQLLISNGRIESDLLDQLNDLLATRPGAVSADAVSAEKSASESFPASAPPAAWANPPAGADKAVADKGVANHSAAKPSGNSASANSDAAEPAIAAPMPTAPTNDHSLSSKLQPGLTAQQLSESKNSRKPDSLATSLQAQAASLEDVLKNQAHPRNLVAIKKSGTPVVSTPSLSGKTLFLASAHDEFEMLDFNADWVHVRISGLSRGWIWRTSLEMPEGISDIPLNRGKAAPVAADLFQVTREETGPFPGDWEPLRGKNVKIVSVQKIQEDEKNSGAQAKLEFAKSLLDKDYAELAAKPHEFAGVVLIFDSVDGGMIAATLPTVQKWKAGTLSDAALWHQCFFDPPETFNVASPGGGQ
ncbi:MAG TPA: hypothetical protein VK828_20725 [Terriglobales bacterium]|jgi:hypothetical protein|nr:hypothetical protein [Terriglobales bacterium]